MSATPSGGLKPRQVRTLDGLLALGAERPFCPPELVDELERRLVDGTRDAVNRWTGRSLYVTKSQVLGVRRCEGQILADATTPRARMHPAVAVGIVAHRAVQLSYTHPGREVADYTREALIGARSNDESFDEWWAQTSMSQQSDMLSQISSRVMNFLDDWPPLRSSWDPRFEEPIVAKVGGISLSCRADLVMGRPRPDLKQTLLIVDLKSGMLKDEHPDEATFYALVAALRYRVAPWRSTVYSLASGEYTEPDITPDRLLDAADWVATAVTGLVDVMTEARAAELRAGDHCRYCPVRNACAASPFRVDDITEESANEASPFDLPTITR